MLAAFYHSFLARTVPIVMVLLALQKTLFVEMRPFDVVVQIVLAFAAASGVAAGLDRGASAGFVIGLMFDLGTGSLLGTSAITMGLAGYLAGSIQLIRIEATWWMSAGFAALGAAAGEAGTPVVRFLIGDPDVFAPSLVRDVLVVTAASALLSIVFVPMARWTMRVEKPEWKPEKVREKSDLDA